MDTVTIITIVTIITTTIDITTTNQNGWMKDK
jgi:hypothetical protein